MAKKVPIFPHFVCFSAVLRGVAVLFLLFAAAPAQSQDCAFAAPVCAARDSVFAISAFDPVASAVRIGAETMVTSRHAVADEATVTVFTSAGQPIQASVIPSDYLGDIVLLSVPGFPAGPSLVPEQDTAAKVGETVHSIGADVSKGAIRAYQGGKITIAPAEGHALARLQHLAYSQPGNSGGALVSEDGQLVGIIASGGEGRFEAVPAAAIAELQRRSGSVHAADSAAIGSAIKDCTLLLEDRRGRREPLSEEAADRIEETCMATGNRQYFDLAAQVFGGSRMQNRAFAASKASLEQDPNSLNARLTAAINFHLARWYQEEIPHLRFLMRHIPEDPQVIRLGIQAGIWGGDQDLAEAAFQRLEASNPNMVPAARKFMEAPPPAPPRMALPE